MKFVLPLPPGINRTYGINRKAEFPLYKRQVVRDWEEDAGWVIKRQWKGKPVLDAVQMGITWFYNYDRDIDAGLKVLLDVFQKQLFYKNDRQVRKITHIDMVEDKAAPRVEVEIDTLK
jgi:Holliday junction resolvase RusA-like endonuclease